MPNRRLRTVVVLAVAVSLTLAAAESARAQRLGRCTHETLMVQGLPVTAQYCVVSEGRARRGSELPVSVMETFSTPRGSFSKPVAFVFIAGEPISRVMEDVPLQRLGLPGVLHLSLAHRRGAVRIEGAMLTPGAITIK